MSSEIKVSVCVVTYNQEKYIAECLQSLVDQVTDFPFEIIVGEDCSTDKTREIVEEFALKYPDLIVRNYYDENVGPTKNVLSTYALAKGKYIAHMDGDDIALPNKLQRQVELLDANPDCFISSHAVMKINSNSSSLGKFSGDKIKGIKDYNYLVNNLPFFAHSSKMFRNNGESSFNGADSGELFDFELHLLHVKNGNIIHTDEVLGAYRVATGVALGGGKLNRLMVEHKFRVYESILNNPAGFCINEIKIAFAKSALNYAIASYLNGDFISFKTYIKKSLSLSIIGFKQGLFFFLSCLPVCLNRKVCFCLNKVFK